MTVLIEDHKKKYLGRRYILYSLIAFFLVCNAPWKQETLVIQCLDEPRVYWCEEKLNIKWKKGF